MMTPLMDLRMPFSPSVQYVEKLKIRGPDSIANTDGSYRRIFAGGRQRSRRDTKVPERISLSAPCTPSLG